MAGKPELSKDKIIDLSKSFKHVKLPAQKAVSAQPSKSSAVNTKVEETVVDMDINTDIDRTGMALKHTAIKPKFLKRNRLNRMRHSFKYFVYAKGAALLEKIITFLANLLKYLERKITGVPEPIILPPSKYKKSRYQEADEEYFENLSFNNFSKIKKRRSWTDKFLGKLKH